MQVLVVDNQRESAFATQILLEHLGCDTTVVHSGSGAMSAAASTRHDAVLLDATLLDINGYDLAKRFRNDFGLHSTKIFIISSNRASNVDEVNAHGVDAVLLKPVHVEELVRVLGLRPRPHNVRVLAVELLRMWPEATDVEATAFIERRVSHLPSVVAEFLRDWRSLRERLAEELELCSGR
jgi:CheY-like chemotaxis protein